MGSSDKHKVCFEVLGVPAILRALETYTLCGSTLNVVVVGMKAEGVMATVAERFPATAFAYQEKPLGTGHATRRAAALLERLGFEGDVLVVAGDKVIEPRVIRELLATHWRSRAEATVATTRRPPGSSAGIVLQCADGRIVGILEEAERLHLAGVAALARRFANRPVLSPGEIEQTIAAVCSEKVTGQLLDELWPDGRPRTALERAAFERRFPPEMRAGRLRLGAEWVTVSNLLTRCDQMNLSTYVFRAPALYATLDRLKPSGLTGEEYLTDAIGLLARRGKSARIVGCEIADPRDVMAFNNPQELLAIEAVWRQKRGCAVETTPAEGNDTVARAKLWEAMFQAPSATARHKFQRWYTGDVPWTEFHRAVQAFIERFGPERPAAIVRSPGRINLMGRHIDHQGGPVNVMAIDREIVLVAAPRADDTVCLVNADARRFTEHTFRVTDLVARLNWDDWQRVVDGPRLQRLLEEARGDWANYAKAAVLRLQEQFRDRQLRGMDVLVSGRIPMGAGLSSSSALVVAVAEAVTMFNHLPVSARRLVSLCGEGEWFVGTRGGAADHAAIKLSRRGYVTRVEFFPFRIQDAAPFLSGHDLVVASSGIYAGKSAEARDIFNARVTAYHLGCVWFKLLRPDLAARIEHLRDLHPGRLGLSWAEFAGLLRRLPVRLTRAGAQAAFGAMTAEDRQRLEQLFQSHEPPATGYAVRDVVLFGLSEMARARQCLGLLKRGDATELGRLMTTSHEGDRVSRQTARHTWRRERRRVSDAELVAWGRRRDAAARLARLPGAYGCSLPALDRIVDLAVRCPGVVGAQLAGAGLGGCVMVLVQQAGTVPLVRALAEQGIPAEVFRPIAGASRLTLC